MIERRDILVGMTSGMALLAGCSESTKESTDSPTPQEQTLSPVSTTTGSESQTDATTQSRNTPTNSGITSQRSTTTSKPTVKFDAKIDSISKCGRTCRTLKYTIQNRGQVVASNVSVQVQVFTKGEKVYQDMQTIGKVGSRSQLTKLTHEIEVGFGGGSKIKNNDGKVVIKLTPKSSSGTSNTFAFDRTLDV